MDLGLGLAWPSELHGLLEANQFALDVLLALSLRELDHDVLGPDVPVRDVPRVQVRHRLQEISSYLSNLGLLENALLLFDLSCQVVAFHKPIEQCHEVKVYSWTR